MQAQWRDKTFTITQKSLDSLRELSASFKLEKKSDKTSSTNIITGHELQNFTAEYTVGVVVGSDALSEYQTMKKYLGLCGPFILGDALYGPDYVMLKKVSLDTEQLTADGKFITATISLEFQEYSPQGNVPSSTAAEYVSPIKRDYYKEEPKAVEDLVLKVLYNGVNITDSISINQCVHDMFACSQADTLLMKFNDVNKVWDSWKAKNENLIEIVCGIAKSGKMYIDSCDPENGLYELRASSIPPDAKEPHTKSWEDVKLLQLGKEIADRHNLGFESYGVEDRLYSYVRQENESDYEFLQKRCDLESLAFVVYNQKLILYSEEYLESQDAAKELEIAEDADFKYSDDSRKGLSAMTIKNGNITGTYKSTNGLTRTDERTVQTYLSGTDEANRFAKGLLRQENKNLATGYLKDALMREFSAGSVLGIKTQGASSWNGKVLVSHIRQDYVNSATKLFFRKCEVV